MSATATPQEQIAALEEQLRAVKDQSGRRQLRLDQAHAKLGAAWAALGVNPIEAADDPDTAELADSIRVSLRHERDHYEQLLESVAEALDIEDAEDLAGAVLGKAKRLVAEAKESEEHLREVLRRVVEEQNGIAICAWCATPTNSDAESRAAHQRTCGKSPLVAELARLQELVEAKDAQLVELGTARDEAAAERDAAVDGERARRAALLDWCKAWLIRARLAVCREGWEEGMSVGETADALTSVLFNLGCDDGSGRAHDIAETKRLLAMPIAYSPPEPER